MPIKLILSIGLVILVTVFTGFNLNNKTDVWLFFHTFKSVPVYGVILVSFVAGVLVTLPFTFIHKGGKKEQKKEAAKAAKKVSGKKTAGPDAQPVYEDEVLPEASPAGGAE